MVELQQSKGHPYSRIYSYGAARGEQRVTNDDIAGPINSSDEWIRQRTGIITRARAPIGTLAIDLAEQAGREAVAKSGFSPEEIDGIIVATISNVQQSPSMASMLAGRLGFPTAAAFDLNAACAGFTYAVAQADAMIRTGQAEHVLVIGAEKLSDVVDPTDRTISFILGDGAGAAVIGPSDSPAISQHILGGDGARAEAVGMNATLVDMRDEGAAWPTLRQDGPAVFRWAVWEMAKVAKSALDAAGIQASDLAAFIPHQANMRIIDEFAKQLKLPESVVIARDIETTGNTSAASIPLAAHRLLEEHPELSGGLALQIGFGAGLAFGAQIVRLP